MQVTSLGMPRPGTASMRAALRLLGYSGVHYGLDLVDGPSSSNELEKAVNEKFYGKGGRYALLGHCAATTDTPSAFFAEELLTCYPEVSFQLS